MILYLLFFLSGAAALVFETLWFRQAALVFGNSVWASSIVLASFMAGLALGNWGATRSGRGLSRPLRTYALLEIAVAISGLALVVTLPHFAGALAPLFRHLVDHPGLLQAARVGLAFLFMVVPASAMGATLPILIRALTARGAGFGPALGTLYGWNTCGAVAGALAGEGLLIERFGLRGTGALAAALDLIAAWLAWRLSMAREADAAAPAPTDTRSGPPRSAWLLGAAASSGALLLALEVVWFRLLLHFVIQNSLTFALMLAVVLAGIACGGWLAAAWLARRPEAARAAPAIALLASAATVLTYRLPDRLMHASWNYTLGEMAWSALCLMAPTSLLSGILFTLIGRRLREEVGEDSAAAGWLTLANTLGAAVGALAGGFVLLPLLGMENSIGALGAGYALPALLLWRARGETTAAYRRATLAAAALGLGALATFPSGLMERAYRARILRYWHAPGIEVAAWKETTMATLLYTRSQLFSETLSHALLTNGYSMAGTKVASRRYMKQYVYWPVALHAAPRRALLICFGLGSTAAALTDTRELTSIDVVDVSPEVLKMGRLAARPGRPYPLDDPRVRVHVEDGRFFLLTREERYDIITSEPPPPRTPGVVSLYTTEYFRLVRSRLAPGGIATYWLPVHDMSRDEAASILKAFCDAFDDCSVWNGDTFNLMLAGSSGAAYTPSPARLERQWRDPELTAELHAVGFDTPAALFATYIGDAPYVAEWTRGVRPLEDDFPHRLAPRPAPPDSGNDHLAFMDADAAAERFRASAWPRRLGGGALVEETLRLFPLVQILNRRAISGDPQVYADRARALLESPSPWLSLTVFASDPDQVAIAERAAARRVQDENLSYIRALGEAARHRYEEAEHLMQDALARQPHTPHLAEFRVLLLCLQGRTRDAWTAIDAWAAARKPPLDPPFQSWAARECPRPRH